MGTSGNLLIRADAGPCIGVGHVMRCLALAQAWREAAGEVTFACKSLPEKLRARLSEEGFRLHGVGPSSDLESDARFTRDLARELNAAVVLDGYHFSQPYQAILHREVVRLLVIDDHGQIGGYRADLILDQNLAARADIYEDRPADCRVLAGPEYILLRREFTRTSTRQQHGRNPVGSILVTFGGGDGHDITSRVMQALEHPTLGGVKIVVAVGAANPRVASIERAASESRHRVSVLVDPSDMATVMETADLAICAAGSTCWELAYSCVPMLLVVTASNQAGVARALVRARIALVLSSSPDLDERTVLESLRKVMRDEHLRQSMADMGRGIVDGRGVGRVVKILKADVEDHSDRHDGTRMNA